MLLDHISWPFVGCGGCFFPPFSQGWVTCAERQKKVGWAGPPVVGPDRVLGRFKLT